jgi:uncharacterized protein (DUF697 family)
MAGGPQRMGIGRQLRLLIAGLLRLIGQLANLTGAELKNNAGQLRAPLAGLFAAMALMLTALTLLLVAGVLALATLVGPIAAAVITALLAALAGWALAQNALARLSAIDLAPRRSIATLKAQVDRFAGPQKDKEHEQPDD